MVLSVVSKRTLKNIMLFWRILHMCKRFSDFDKCPLVEELKMKYEGLHFPPHFQFQPCTNGCFSILLESFSSTVTKWIIPCQVILEPCWHQSFVSLYNILLAKSVSVRPSLNLLTMKRQWTYWQLGDPRGQGHNGYLVANIQCLLSFFL